jgi:pilus assembly protein CpaE
MRVPCWLAPAISLTKPPSIDELTAAINRAGAMASEERTKAATTAPSGSAIPAHLARVLPQRMKNHCHLQPQGWNGCTTISTTCARHKKR